MSFHHLPVLLSECLDGLNLRPDGAYLDCTLGGAGHSSEILKRLGEGGLLVGIDRDADAIEAASARLAAIKTPARFACLRGNFHDAPALLEAAGLPHAFDGILVELVHARAGQLEGRLGLLDLLVDRLHVSDIVVRLKRQRYHQITELLAQSNSPHIKKRDKLSRLRFILIILRR